MHFAGNELQPVYDGPKISPADTSQALPVDPPAVASTALVNPTTVASTAPVELANKPEYTADDGPAPLIGPSTSPATAKAVVLTDKLQGGLLVCEAHLSQKDQVKTATMISKNGGIVMIGGMRVFK